MGKFSNQDKSHQTYYAQRTKLNTLLILYNILIPQLSNASKDLLEPVW